MRFGQWSAIPEVKDNSEVMDGVLIHRYSIGSTAGLKYATTCQKPLAHFVNVSGRYQMNDPQIFRNRPHFFEELEKKVIVMRCEDWIKLYTQLSNP